MPLTHLPASRVWLPSGATPGVAVVWDYGQGSHRLVVEFLLERACASGPLYRDSVIARPVRERGRERGRIMPASVVAMNGRLAF